MTFKHCKYIGNVEGFKGHTALVIEEGMTAGTVLVQFDNRNSLFAYGWHEFQSSDWEEMKDA